jgi:hypothetical protein
MVRLRPYTIHVAATVHLACSALLMASCAPPTETQSGRSQKGTEATTQLPRIAFPDTTYRYPTPEGCEGQGAPCNYGRWTVRTPMTVYGSPGDTTHVVGEVAAGDTIVSDQGWIYVDRPGVVVVRDTCQDWPDGLTSRKVTVGDTLFVMRALCEISYVVWHKGRFFDIEAFWSGSDRFGTGSPGGHQIIKPLLSWWVHFRSPAFRDGWLRVIRKGLLDGPDRHCPKFKMRPEGSSVIM